MQTNAVPTKITELTEDTFDEEVMSSPVPVVVELWADWCRPCQTLAPVLAGIADDYAGRLRVMKVNSDQNPGITVRFDATSVPTFLVFSGGILERRMVGARGRNNFLENIRDLLN